MMAWEIVSLHTLLEPPTVMGILLGVMAIVFEQSAKWLLGIFAASVLGPWLFFTYGVWLLRDMPPDAFFGPGNLWMVLGVYLIAKLPLGFCVGAFFAVALQRLFRIQLG